MYNFYSDTQTRPSRAMRESILDAEVGDERHDDCPTTRELNARVAEMFGMEAAVFMPSGTMCNEIAIAVHCRPGDEVICARESHVIFAESGGPAALSGVMMNGIDGQRGMMSVDEVADAIRPPSSFAPRSRLVITEQTANLAGGAIWPVKDYAKHHDSAWLAFTKGLGCPVGAVLAGSKEFIQKAWLFKRRWGGAMRQTGVLSAMCLYALEHNVARLAEDHKLARLIGDRLSEHTHLGKVLPVDSNIVMLELADDMPDARRCSELLKQQGVQVTAVGRDRLRMVTHLDVPAGGADALIGALSGITAADKR